MKNVNDRGIYLVVYTGPGQGDRKNDPGYLWLPPGCCKFGQSLSLSTVEKRYQDWCSGNADVILVGHFKDRDDIDTIEKALHHKFTGRRLKNRNNRLSEWMQAIPMAELRNAVSEAIQEHFKLWK
mgnify:CR=1 FL=1|jgi:hypothetical protein